MPDFSPDEINLIFIYGNDEKKTLVKQLTQMLDDAEDKGSIVIPEDHWTFSIRAPSALFSACFGPFEAGFPRKGRKLPG